MKMKYTIPKLMGFSKSSSKKEVHCDKHLPQETRKISNIQPNFMPQGTRRRANEA